MKRMSSSWRNEANAQTTLKYVKMPKPSYIGNVVNAEGLWRGWLSIQIEQPIRSFHPVFLTFQRYGIELRYAAALSRRRDLIRSRVVRRD